MIKGLEHLSYKKRQTTGIFQPGEEKAQRELLNMYNHLMETKRRETNASQWSSVNGEEVRVCHGFG